MKVQPGTELKAPNGRSYRLLHRLGGGRYSEVWQAQVVDEPERQVAVKIMVSAPDERERQIFAREAEILLHLASVEEAMGLRLGGCSLLPNVEAIADEFFVETLAPGKPLDQVLREERRLPEPEVLAIGEQLCRVFQALHEGLRRSYLDFQPRNVFWDYKTRRIMVVDWNLLSPEGQVNVTRDLETIARLLYRLVVGEGWSSERLEEPQGWRTLTSGTREVLARALHNNLARRYSSAASLRAALAAQLTWWGSEANDLLREAAQYLETAVVERKEDCYRQAKQVLDIAERKGAELSLVEQLRERAVRGTSCSEPYLKEGVALLRTGDRLAAKAAFARGLEEAVSFPDRLLFRRWQEVAGAAPWISLDRAARVIEDLAFWTEAEWEGRKWSIRSTLSMETREPSFLDREWEAWQILAQVRAESPGDKDEMNYRRVANSYRKIQALVRTLPYSEELLSLWGDLEGEAQHWENQANALHWEWEKLHDLQQAFQQGWDKGLQNLKTALRKEPENEALTRLALSWAQQLFHQGQFSECKQLLDQIMMEAHPALLSEILLKRRQAMDALMWQHQLDEIKGSFFTLLGAKDQVFPLRPGFERCARYTAGSWQPTSQDSADLQPSPGGEEQATKWLDIVQTLGTLAEAAQDNPPLRSKGWDVFRQVFTLPTLPYDVLPQLEGVGAALAPNEETWRTFCEQTGKKRKENELRMNIAKHCWWAKERANFGLISAMSEATNHLTQARKLAEELGDARLLREINARYQEQVNRQQTIQQYLQGAEALALKRDWSGAVKLLEKLEKEWNISGLNQPGEMQKWLADLRFREAIASFEEALHKWNDVEPWRKTLLLQQMKRALNKMQEQAPYLDERARGQLAQLEAQYRDCCAREHIATL